MIGWHEHGIGPPASREPRSTERISIMSGEDTMDLCHAEPAVHEPAILPFDHDDAFGLDAQLSDEERLVRDTAEAFAQERLQPRRSEEHTSELQSLLRISYAFFCL